jgi:hypothetical protein
MQPTQKAQLFALVVFYALLGNFKYSCLESGLNIFCLYIYKLLHFSTECTLLYFLHSFCKRIAGFYVTMVKFWN